MITWIINGGYRMEKNKQGDVLYSIVKEKIIEMINNGKYNIGDKLLSEAQFCDVFNVSRTTVRIALQQLELEGRICRVQGKGTFVSKSKIQQSLSSAGKGFAQQMIEQGVKPEAKVVTLQVIPATQSIARTLEIQEGDPINKLVRIRYANDEPIQYEVAYLPWKITMDLVQEDCKGSLYRLLREKYKVNIGKAVEGIEPILSDEVISSHLEIQIGALCLSIETTAYSTDMSPIEYSYAVFRGDRSKFIIERDYNSL